MIQLQFLNFLLKTKDSSLLLMNNISDEFFPEYEQEYKYVKEHLEKYNQIPDQLTFLDKFPKFDIIEVSENSDYLVDKLYEERNTRQLAEVFNKVRTKLIEGDVEDAMSIYTSSVDTVLQAKHVDSIDLLKDISRYDDYVDKITNYDKHFIQTGFKELDEILGGWDIHEELATIVARSNKGKSWILLKSSAKAVEQGLRVGVYSGEMSPNKVGYRFDTLLSHLSNSAMVRGKQDIQNAYRKYLEELPGKYTGCYKVLTPNMIDGPIGVTALRAFIEKEKLDILFIDQHSLLEDDRKARNSVERAANISKDLKKLQVTLGIPIITVSQQNRGNTDDGVGLHNIAQSDRIGQDSTVVLFFDQKDGIMEMNLVKSRDSANNKSLNYAIDFDKGIFEYIPESDNAIDGKGTEELAKEFNEEDVF